MNAAKHNHRIVIVGGGTGGITVAARLRKSMRRAEVTIIEPSSKHYYQPLWTLVGGGVFRREVTERDEASVIPRRNVAARRCDQFAPQDNTVITRDGKRIEYDYLVVAPGHPD